MKTTELAKDALKSGITPISIVFHEVKRFLDDDIILRSYLKIESLDLGVLTPVEYRFAARRTKQGERLTQRHIEKLFSSVCGLLEADKRIKSVAIPVFPKVLVDGALAVILFNAFTKYNRVNAKRICVEFSSDILFENFSAVKFEIEKIKSFGVKVAISEVGDELCPLTRLAELAPDFVFADEVKEEQLLNGDKTVENLVKYLEIGNIEVYAPVASKETAALAQGLGFKGFVNAEPYILAESEDYV